MPEIVIHDDESFERALRRFKKKCEKAGILSDLRKHPSERYRMLYRGTRSYRNVRELAGIAQAPNLSAWPQLRGKHGAGGRCQLRCRRETLGANPRKGARCRSCFGL